MHSKHIVLATDNNYVQHLGVTLMSLLENNKDDSFVIHIFSNGAILENREKEDEMNFEYAWNGV